MSTDTLLSRFLRYVQIHTTSDPNSETTPSSPQQWDLLRLLRDELQALGAQEVRLNEYGYVFATIPATTTKHVPTLAFVAHVDTTPDFPGADVKPLIHRNYDGRPIVLPDDPSRVLDPDTDPDLKTAIGKDIVTASGTTLLGADDKAGVAIVMTLAAHLLAHPEIKHGPIRVCFNPDEEIGRGMEKLDLKELGADVAYTLDGEHPGEINWETFSGDSATVTIEGVATHPGWARSRGMVNAVQLAARLLAALPREHLAPETTDGRQGFIHPHNIKGNAAKVTISFILRDFDNDRLAQHGARLKALCEGLQGAEPRARITCEIKPSYRNMGYWLRNDMRPVDYAFEAVRAVGLQPRERAIRGGTDGSRLTERGLPTPNIFDGCHNPHGPLEWVCVQDMEAAVQVCVKLAEIWEQRS
ncbi:MAG: peptidase T [Anaerolineales bacterium]|nr:peptidase T [Anaerolineales bacterium]